VPSAHKKVSIRPDGKDSVDDRDKSHYDKKIGAKRTEISITRSATSREKIPAIKMGNFIGNAW